MKLLFAVILFAFVIRSAPADEKPPSPVIPQPRVRLDPNRQTAVTTPVEVEKKTTEIPYMLERMVVKERRALPSRPPAVEDPTGKFSPLDGGRMLRRDACTFRFEAGLWPHIELFDEEARFKPTKVRIDFDFLRIKW